MTTNSPVSRQDHFLTYELWREALKLLNFQIDAQKENRYFKTVSMIYYKRLDGYINKLESEEYFKEKISNNLFYGMEDEFSIYSYVIPKTGLGVRNYKFFTYPMRVLYYTVGLYLMKVSREFRHQFIKKRKDKSSSYYGGGIDFENNKLNITKNNIYYLSYYKQFLKEIKNEIKDNNRNKIVIKFDIQNFFDEISIPIFLELLEEFIKPSEKAQMHFDTYAIEQIIFFFRFITKDVHGIPQSDNDIISSFIGHLYLLFGDLFIQQELSKYHAFLDQYKIIRYVDDIYIFIIYKEHISSREREEHVDSIACSIADLLYYRLNLRLNLKTRAFFLDDEEQQEQLRTSLKKVSSEHYAPSDDDDDKDESPTNKISNIFKVLEELKESRVNPENFEHGTHSEILKEVYDKIVLQMLEMDINKKRIREIFTGFDFNYVKEYPLEISVILLKDQDSEKRFRDFLLNKNNLTTRDVDVMLRYLCQKDFDDIDIISKLQSYKYIKNIMCLFDEPKISFNCPGYYTLSETKIRNILKMPSVIEQICYRVFNERIKFYSVALNHLVNEIHGICLELEKPRKPKEYDANKIVDFIDSRGVSLETCISIRNLFDRRNINQVSHPGSEENITSSVTVHEYNEFRKQVGMCLETLL